MKLNRYLSIIAIAAMFASCSQQGATGPAGPQGPAGANGVSGLTTNGYTVSSASWTPSGSEYYVATTQTIPLTDVAVVYYSINSGNSYSPLPATSVFAYGDYLTFSYSNTGALTLWYTPNPSASVPGGVLINVVDIPPSVQNSRPNTNWENASEIQYFPEVQAALHNTNNK
jgi:hypothetical protein